ncbi:MAG: phosphatase PAP2 family protein [Chloroflexaceae bacterium]|nr:phosphatase PAP2 family protein [Chloroflexaceae bacterium]
MAQSPTTTEPQRVFVVYNPESSRGSRIDLPALLEEQFTAFAVDYELFTLEKSKDLAAAIRQALKDGYTTFVAAGGDGTVSAVANVLAKLRSKATLAILPAGTANVLAQELNVPLDITAACSLMLGDHETTTIDAMRIGEHIAVLQIGIGLESEMIRDTDKSAKQRFGRAAYLWTAAARLFGYESPRFTIVADGKRIRPRALHVTVANGGVLGMAPFRWGPHIRPDDGRIDVSIMSARSLADFFGLAWDVIRGKHFESRRVRFLGARQSITIDCDRPLPVQADGEIIGNTPVRVEVVPKAVQVIVPPAAAPAATAAPTAAVAEETGDLLTTALRQIRDPQHAEAVVEQALAAGAGKGELQVRAVGQITGQPEQAVRLPTGDAAARALVEGSAQVAAATGPAREALAEAAQLATNPAQHGLDDVSTNAARVWLRQAVLRRMGPIQKADAGLFLAINRLPHTSWSNEAMTQLTNAMNGGNAWVAVLLLAALLDKRRGQRALYSSLPPLWFATMAVEYPIKRFFQRRRPFIDIVQAIAVGRKPNTFSFPSGHSAAAFAGAWLLTRHYPRLAPLWYSIASLVGFSRIYLGVHYPGDVLSGALSGTVIAEAMRQFMASPLVQDVEGTLNDER